MLYFIQAAVGMGQVNYPADVAVIQELLNLSSWGKGPLNMSLAVTGVFNLNTQTMLANFIKAQPQTALSLMSYVSPSVQPGDNNYWALIRAAVGPFRDANAFVERMQADNLSFEAFKMLLQGKDPVLALLAAVSKNVNSSKLGPGQCVIGILRAMSLADINTPIRKAAFLGQVATETDGFFTLEEYASGNAYEGRADLGNCRAGDGKKFKGRGFIQLTGRANYTAAWVALGGMFQTVADAAVPTDYKKLHPKGKATLPEFDVVNPEYAQTADGGARTAAHYWKTHNINALADQLMSSGAGEKSHYYRISKAVNNPWGTPNHPEKRWDYYVAAKKALGVTVPLPAAKKK